MTPADQTPEMLREAFVTLGVHARPTDDCPAADTIWEAVGGELSSSDTENLVDHISTCAACAEAWRIANELSASAPSTLVFRPRARTLGLLFRRPGALAAGIAATLVVAVGGIYLIQSGPQTGEFTYRQVDALTIRSLLNESAPLSRERCVFRWSPGPEGTTYRVRVSREDLTLITVAERVERAEYQVPAVSLASVAAGARLLWQVEALLPGGARIVSPTFIAVVQ